MGVMEHIITKGEEEAYQSEIQHRNAQNEFKRFIRCAEGWRKLEFVSSILGMIALMDFGITKKISRIEKRDLSKISQNRLNQV